MKWLLGIGAAIALAYIFRNELVFLYYTRIF